MLLTAPLKNLKKCAIQSDIGEHFLLHYLIRGCNKLSFSISKICFAIFQAPAAPEYQSLHWMWNFLLTIDPFIVHDLLDFLDNSCFRYIKKTISWIHSTADLMFGDDCILSTYVFTMFYRMTFFDDMTEFSDTLWGKIYSSSKYILALSFGIWIFCRTSSWYLQLY